MRVFPPARIYQADNLAKLRQEFLSVTELIVKIFGAVSRTISLMWLSALLARKRCRCHNDGFCSFFSKAEIAGGYEKTGDQRQYRGKKHDVNDVNDKGVFADETD